MSENYHGRIMNIRCESEDCGCGDSLPYKEGHRDARHAAAEIALGADSAIETLKSDNARLQSLTTEQALEAAALRAEIDEYEVQVTEQAAEIEGLKADADRWRHARRILTVDDIEGAQGSYDSFDGSMVSEDECVRADKAIDEALTKGREG